LSAFSVTLRLLLYKKRSFASLAVATASPKAANTQCEAEQTLKFSSADYLSSLR